MAIETKVRLLCDAGCGRFIAIPGEQRVGKLRKRARNLGWKCRDGRDWCESCFFEFHRKLREAESAARGGTRDERTQGEK